MSKDQKHEASSTGIERIGPLPLSELRSRYLDRNIPVIVKEHVTEWPAYKKWSPEYLANKYGHKPVQVVAMRDGDYANASSIKIPLAQYLQRIGAIDGTDESFEGKTLDPELTYYLAQMPLEQFLPELLDDVEVPPFFDKEKFGTAVIYIGAHLFSQLHYHPNGSATLCLLYGEKRVRLFGPEQTPYVYPYPANSRTPNVSRTRHKDPDPNEFPDFAKAKFLEDTVRAGELLFIPIYWWHSVENEDTSIATVFFWRRSWRSRFLPPPHMRAQYALEAVNRPINLGKRVARKLGKIVRPAKAG